MLNRTHKAYPAPTDLASHAFGMLCEANPGEFDMLASGKEGSYVYLAVEHAPIAGQDCMSGIYSIEWETKDHGFATAFMMQSEHMAPYEAARCPVKVLKAAKGIAGNTLFRDTSAMFQKSKKAMSALKIGDIVLMRKSVQTSFPGRLLVVAQYTNRDLWTRQIESGPDININSDPLSLYPFGPEIVYPELLEPVAAQENFVLVAGFYYACVGGENIIMGRPFTEFELANIRRDKFLKAQDALASRQVNRRRTAFL
jgi:hypothetical protein